MELVGLGLVRDTETQCHNVKIVRHAYSSAEVESQYARPEKYCHIIRNDESPSMTHLCLTWSFRNFFLTLECALSEALCHPGQHLSTISDLEPKPEMTELYAIRFILLKKYREQSFM